MVAPLPEAGGTDLIHFADFSPEVVDIGKDHGRTAENPILQGHALIDADVVLNLAVVADLYTSRQTRFVQRQYTKQITNDSKKHPYLIPPA